MFTASAIDVHENGGDVNTLRLLMSQSPPPMPSAPCSYLSESVLTSSLLTEKKGSGLKIDNEVGIYGGSVC